MIIKKRILLVKKNFSQIWIVFGSLLVDVNTIGRMFKKFNDQTVKLLII